LGTKRQPQLPWETYRIPLLKPRSAQKESERKEGAVITLSEEGNGIACIQARSSSLSLASTLSSSSRVDKPRRIILRARYYKERFYIPSRNSLVRVSFSSSSKRRSSFSRLSQSTAEGPSTSYFYLERIHSPHLEVSGVTRHLRPRFSHRLQEGISIPIL
jgi:hypothetical protein